MSLSTGYSPTGSCQENRPRRIASRERRAAESTSASDASGVLRARGAFGPSARYDALAMARTRVLQFLRIAVSAMCGMLCLVLIALWVRSYRNIDVFERVDNIPTLTTFGVNGGTLFLHQRDLRGVNPDVLGLDPTPHGWDFQSHSLEGTPGDSAGVGIRRLCIFNCRFGCHFSFLRHWRRSPG
jgi:hypothetical protein